MDAILEKLLKEIGQSPTDINKKAKNISKRFPVPNDYKILWADIKNFVGSPVGIVLTDKGLVYKTSKDKNDSNNKNGMYQIIKWENFDIEDYSLEKTVVENKTEYMLNFNNQKLMGFSSTTLYNFFNKYSKEAKQLEQRADSVIDSIIHTDIGIGDLKNTAFHAAYGADQ